MKQVVFFVFILMLTACSATTLSLDSGPMTTSMGSGYHWASSTFPIPVMMDPTMDPSHYLATVQAALTWNRLVGADIFVPQDAPRSFMMFRANGEQNVHGYISVEDRDLVTGGTGRFMGLARVALEPGPSGLVGQIHSAHIYMSVGLTDYNEIVGVAFHEFGHVLGLDHDANDRTSIMYFTTTIGGQTLQDEDLEYVRRQVGRWGRSAIIGRLFE